MPDCDGRPPMCPISQSRILGCHENPGHPRCATTSQEDHSFEPRANQCFRDAGDVTCGRAAEGVALVALLLLVVVVRLDSCLPRIPGCLILLLVSINPWTSSLIGSCSACPCQGWLGEYSLANANGFRTSQPGSRRRLVESTND